MFITICIIIGIFLPNVIYTSRLEQFQKGVVDMSQKFAKQVKKKLVKVQDRIVGVEKAMDYTFIELDEEYISPAQQGFAQFTNFAAFSCPVKPKISIMNVLSPDTFFVLSVAGIPQDPKKPYLDDAVWSAFRPVNTKSRNYINLTTGAISTHERQFPEIHVEDFLSLDLPQTILNGKHVTDPTYLSVVQFDVARGILYNKTKWIREQTLSAYTRKEKGFGNGRKTVPPRVNRARLSEVFEKSHLGFAFPVHGVIRDSLEVDDTSFLENMAAWESLIIGPLLIVYGQYAKDWLPNLPRTLSKTREFRQEIDSVSYTLFRYVELCESARDWAYHDARYFLSKIDTEIRKKYNGEITREWSDYNRFCSPHIWSNVEDFLSTTFPSIYTDPTSSFIHREFITSIDLPSMNKTTTEIFLSREAEQKLIAESREDYYRILMLKEIRKQERKDQLLKGSDEDMDDTRLKELMPDEQNAGDFSDSLDSELDAAEKEEEERNLLKEAFHKSGHWKVNIFKKIHTAQMDYDEHKKRLEAEEKKVDLEFASTGFSIDTEQVHHIMTEEYNITKTATDFAIMAKYWMVEYFRYTSVSYHTFGMEDILKHSSKPLRFFEENPYFLVDPIEKFILPDGFTINKSQRYTDSTYTIPKLMKTLKTFVKPRDKIRVDEKARFNPMVKEKEDVQLSKNARKRMDPLDIPDRKIKPLTSRRTGRKKAILGRTRRHPIDYVAIRKFYYERMYQVLDDCSTFEKCQGHLKELETNFGEGDVTRNLFSPDEYTNFCTYFQSVFNIVYAYPDNSFDFSNVHAYIRHRTWQEPLYLQWGLNQLIDEINTSIISRTNFEDVRNVFPTYSIDYILTSVFTKCFEVGEMPCHEEEKSEQHVLHTFDQSQFLNKSKIEVEEIPNVLQKFKLTANQFPSPNEDIQVLCPSFGKSEQVLNIDSIEEDIVENNDENKFFWRDGVLRHLAGYIDSFDKIIEYGKENGKSADEGLTNLLFFSQDYLNMVLREFYDNGDALSHRLYRFNSISLMTGLDVSQSFIFNGVLSLKLRLALFTGYPY